MADGQPVARPHTDRGPDPDEVARRTFATTFRGFDQHEVRGFLVRLAGEIRTLLDRERDARQRLDLIDARPAPDGEPDEEQLLATLGQEAARVLQAAKEAAADIRGKAEEHVARLVREAQEEAARVRSEAEQLLELRTGEAEQAAEVIRSEATREADAEVERARTRGKEMLAEAQAVRERILRDLARRRRLAHQQIEQLRAGRDRLLEAYRVVRQTLDEATGELSRAESEARAAAEAAAHRASAEAEASVDELEAELAAARDAGVPILDDEATIAAPTDEAAAQVPETDEQPAHDEGEPEPVAEAPSTGPPIDAGAASEAASEAAPKPPPSPAAEERRSSALRLLRRRREPEPEEAPAAHAGAVDVGDDVEGVRVIRPASAPPPEPATEGRAGESPAERESELDAEAADEPADEHAPDVDELFARIRADREAAVAKAEEVLAENGSSPVDAAAEESEAAEAEAEVAGEAVEDELTDEAAGEATPEDHDRELLSRRDELVAPLEKSATRAVKRLLTDEQNEVLDNLRTRRGKPRASEILPAEAAHASRYASAVTKQLGQAAAAGAAFVGGTDGADVADLAATLAAEITSGLRERVERCIEESGGSDEEQALTDRISAAYREWKTQRTEPLVVDAVVDAFSKGSYESLPDGASLRWVVDFAGKACPDGDDNALAGLTAKGDRFPTGQCHPPAHAGCRCILVPDSL